MSVRGQEKEIGSVLRDNKTMPVESGMRVTTNRIGRARKREGASADCCGICFSAKSNVVFVVGEDSGSTGSSNVVLGRRCSHCRKRDATNAIIFESDGSE